MNTRLYGVIGLGLIGLGACLPAHLAKYRKEKGEGSSASAPQGAPLSIQDPLVGSGPPASLAPPAQSATAPSQARAEPVRGAATIYAVDRQIFRFALREGDVWDAALNVLLRNYNLTIVDRQSGIITTEWDSFFLKGAVYRNKVSLRVSRSNWNNVDVMIVNNVERLRDAAQAAGTVGAVWLPADDPAGESSRIIQNMALVLNQPPPQLPPNSAVARKSEGDDQGRL